MIETDSERERESEKSVLAVWHDDDDDEKIFVWVFPYVGEKVYLCANLWADVARISSEGKNWNGTTNIYIKQKCSRLIYNN